MGKNDMLAVLRDYKRRFAEKYGVSAIGIFGSMARDSAREDSDVDVVVKMEKPDLFYLVHIKEELEETCRKKVDIVHYREKMNPFLKECIDRDAVYA